MDAQQQPPRTSEVQQEIAKNERENGYRVVGPRELGMDQEIPPIQGDSKTGKPYGR